MQQGSPRGVNFKPAVQGPPASCRCDHACGALSDPQAGSSLTTFFMPSSRGFTASHVLVWPRQTEEVAFKSPLNWTRAQANGVGHYRRSPPATSKLTLPKTSSFPAKSLIQFSLMKHNFVFPEHQVIICRG